MPLKCTIYHNVILKTLWGIFCVPSHTVTCFNNFISNYRAVLMFSCLVAPGDSKVSSDHQGERRTEEWLRLFSCSIISHPVNLLIGNEMHIQQSSILTTNSSYVESINAWGQNIGLVFLAPKQ